MGYYTRHELYVKGTVSEEKLIEMVEYLVDKDLTYEVNEFEGMQSIVLYGAKVYFGDEPCKWYKSSKDMQEMSLRFENTIFELCGQGEESGDIWKAYYLNGKEQMCKAKLTFEEFDLNKLK